MTALDHAFTSCAPLHDPLLFSPRALREDPAWLERAAGPQGRPAAAPFGAQASEPDGSRPPLEGETKDQSTPLPLPAQATTQAAEPCSLSGSAIATPPFNPMAGLEREAFSLPGTAPGGAIATVLAERLQQVHRHGHTPASDAQLPLRHFLRELRELVAAASDDHRFDPGDLPRLRRRCGILGAFTLATIDRIDAEHELALAVAVAERELLL